MELRRAALSHLSLRTTKISGKRAAIAFGNAAAMRLAHCHGERVKLIEELNVRGRGIIGEGAAGEIGK